jgi:HEAT repeat protein
MAFTFQERLHKPGATAIPRLARLLAADPSPGVRREAARALSDYQPESSAVLPVIMRALDDPSEPVQFMALCALRQAGPEAWPVLPQVMAWLKDRGARSTALEVLMNMGPAARPAIPAIIDLLDDEDGEVVSDAGWALERIGGIAKATARAAAAALARLKPSDTQAVLHLIEALDRVEYWNGRAFAEAIGALGRTDGPALAALRNRLRSDRPYTRVWAAYA